MLGKHPLKSWSKTQSLIVLSSEESEFYAALKASAETLGFISMMKDFGYETKGGILGDASAAPGIIHRKGLGRPRHIDTGLLCIQQTAAEKRLKYSKVLGTVKTADLVTKYLSSEVLGSHCARLNSNFKDGRAQAAPTLDGPMAYWELK